MQRSKVEVDIAAFDKSWSNSSNTHRQPQGPIRFGSTVESRDRVLAGLLIFQRWLQLRDDSAVAVPCAFMENLSAFLLEPDRLNLRNLHLDNSFHLSTPEETPLRRRIVMSTHSSSSSQTVVIVPRMKRLATTKKKQFVGRTLSLSVASRISKSACIRLTLKRAV